MGSLKFWLCFTLILFTSSVSFTSSEARLSNAFSYKKKQELMERAHEVLKEYLSRSIRQVKAMHGERGLILEATVIQGIKQLNMDASIQITDNISEADAPLALQSRLKKNSRIQAAAKSHDTPIYVTKANFYYSSFRSSCSLQTSSLVQITKAIQALVNDRENALNDFGSKDDISLSEKIDALEEAQIAIEKVVIPKGESVELLPRPSSILSLRMELIRKYQLQSIKVGTEPEVRLCILPYQTRLHEEDISANEIVDEDDEMDEFVSADDDTNGSIYSMDRLPILPD